MKGGLSPAWDREGSQSSATMDPEGEAMAKTPKTDSTEIQVQPLKRAHHVLRIIGTTGLYQNRMSNKVMQGLLVGTKKKTRAERVDIKHDPFREFRMSMERMEEGPTALGLRVVAVKAAMCTAALETPGLTKSSTQRLLFMPGDLTSLYGVPKLRLDVVRSADINRTPDIRSRAFLAKWAASIPISFVTPQLSIQSVVSLLSNAGILVGVGDFRQEKGKGAFGSFRVIGDDQPDSEWDEIIATGGREAQLKAIENPAFADRDTEDLMQFYEQEVSRRAA